LHAAAAVLLLLLLLHPRMLLVRQACQAMHSLQLLALLLVLHQGVQLPAAGP
jgi:hypothetical protein